MVAFRPRRCAIIRVLPVFRRFRWVVLSLLFFATTINYLDRIVFTVLIPEIRKDLHLSDLDYGYINAAFQLAYTLGFPLLGRFVDWCGTRIGYLVSMVAWSITGGLTATASTATALGAWRFLLGVGESGNFPCAIKAVAEWFPVKDRALATGIFNAGANVAATIGPPVIVALQAAYGWRAAFLITATLGAAWAPLWWLLYDRPGRHPRVSAPELAYIRSGEAEAGAPRVGWLAALAHRQTWGFAVAKFLTDPVWWFYLFWLPPYLYDVRHFNLRQIGWALPVIYLAADVGSVGGGWISSRLIRRGWPVGRARMAAMRAAAVCMPVAATAVAVESPILAIALISLATAAHQGWSANLFTTTSDVFPSHTVASVVGIGGCAGGMGGLLFAALIPGFVITYFGYAPVFVLMGALHPLALIVAHRLMGRMERISSEGAM